MKQKLLSAEFEGGQFGPAANDDYFEPDPDGGTALSVLELVLGEVGDWR